MYTLRAIRMFLAIGWFILLLTACSSLQVPAAATNQTVHIYILTDYHSHKRFLHTQLSLTVMILKCIQKRCSRS